MNAAKETRRVGIFQTYVDRRHDQPLVGLLGTQVEAVHILLETDAVEASPALREPLGEGASPGIDDQVVRPLMDEHRVLATRKLIKTVEPLVRRGNPPAR